MKKLCLTLLSLCSVLSPFSLANAACSNVTCAELGYSKSDVAGCKSYIYCPLDASYKACYSYKSYTNGACPTGANCDMRYKKTKTPTCIAGYYNNNGTCTVCPVGTYQDQTGQTSCKTCATATTTGATSCTITCDEAIQKAGGIKLTNQTTIEYGPRHDYYLTQNLDLGDVDELYDVSFYAASSLPECAKDSSIAKTPTIEIGTIGNMYGMIGLYVNTNISRAIFGLNGESPELFVSNTINISELVMDNSNEETYFTLECNDLNDPNISGVNADIGYTCEYGGNQQCNMTIQCQNNDSIKLTQRGLQTNIWCHGSMVNKYESNDCGISLY